MGLAACGYSILERGTPHVAPAAPKLNTLLGHKCLFVWFIHDVSWI